jgi:hypothetical protein
MQQPPQYPFPPPQRPLPHQRFWRWFHHLSTKVQIITIVVLILSCTLCSYISLAANTSVTPTAATPTATQDVAAITTNAAPTATPIPTPSPTATPKPTPKPTQLAVKPTPKPTQKPAPTPTPKPHCTGVNGNPWCYDFNPGNLIYYPPSGFCGYFNCIASFNGADDPGDGYVVECSDGTFSQSGGERGACSYHGGVSRPLYSH